MSAMPSLAGHSGCTLQLRGPRVLRKTSASPDYSPRLRKQIQKQRAMKELLECPGVHIPAILSEGEDAQGCYWADMELYIAKNASAFLSTCDPASIERLARTLLGILAALEAASAPQTLSRTLPLQKCSDIADSLEVQRRDPASRRFLPSPERMDQYRAFLENLLPESLTLRIGASHGDLTLTNLLIRDDGSEIALVDFLDAFVEAPLLDRVKLRQDTCHGWSMVQHPPGPDATRLRMAMGYLDNLLRKAFEGDEDYQRHYGAFQFLNHLRILPYLRDDATASHVLTVLETLMEDPCRRTP